MSLRLIAVHEVPDDDERERILLCLAERLLGYPFDDFPLLDLFEQIMRFRWQSRI